MWILFLVLVVGIAISWCLVQCMNLPFANLVLILSFGVLLSWWTLYYTDWFAVIGGLLALGGAFSWLAFVSHILSKDRIEALQEWVDRQVLNKRGTGTVFIGLTFVGFLTGNLLGPSSNARDSAQSQTMTGQTRSTRR